MGSAEGAAAQRVRAVRDRARARARQCGASAVTCSGHVQRSRAAVTCREEEKATALVRRVLAAQGRVLALGCGES
eukprot:3039918-Rhodomonas_salina.1